MAQEYEVRQAVKDFKERHAPGEVHQQQENGKPPTPEASTRRSSIIVEDKHTPQAAAPSSAALAKPNRRARKAAPSQEAVAEPAAPVAPAVAGSTGQNDKLAEFEADKCALSTPLCDGAALPLDRLSFSLT